MKDEEKLEEVERGERLLINRNFELELNFYCLHTQVHKFQVLKLLQDCK